MPWRDAGPSISGLGEVLLFLLTATRNGGLQNPPGPRALPLTVRGRRDLAGIGLILDSFATPSDPAPESGTILGFQRVLACRSIYGLVGNLLSR